MGTIAKDGSTLIYYTAPDADLRYNSIYVYSEVNHIHFNRTYSRVDILRIATSVTQTLYYPFLVDWRKIFCSKWRNIDDNSLESQ